MPQPQEENALATPQQAQAYWNELDRQDQEGAAPEQSAATTDEPLVTKTGDEPDQSGTKTAETPPQDDPWAGVPKVVKDSLTDIAGKLGTLGVDRLDRIEQALSATVGRVGSIQSQLAKQAEMHKAATAVAATTGSASPSDKQINAAVKDPEKWANLKKDFPEWADGVADYLEAKLAGIQGGRYDDSEVRKSLEESGGKVAGLEKTVATLLQRDEQYREMVVEMRHPDWSKTVVTPQFRQWRNAQPPEVRALGASENPLDAVRMLDLYEEHRKKAPDPEAIERDRKQRLQQSAGVKGSKGTVPVKEWTDEAIRQDPEGYWKYLDELDARRRQDD